MTIRTRKWLEGLLQAFFSGVSSALAVTLIDPSDFGVLSQDKLLKTAAVAAMVGAVQLIQYLSRPPLPQLDDGTTVSQAVLRTFQQPKPKE